MEIATETLSLEDGDLKVELEWIGEGEDGDFRPDDPDDRPLLRFSLLRLDEAGQWQDVEDSSYCTQLDARLPDDVKVQAMRLILAEVGGLSHVKRACERLSWLDEAAVRAGTSPAPGM